MAMEIWLTDGVVRVTAANTAQPLAQAVTVANLDQLDLTLQVSGLEGAGPFSVTITVMTGNSLDSEDGWTTYTTTFTPITSAVTGSNTDKKNFSGLQKYVRWKVTAFNGTTTGVSFSIRGMGRNN